MSKDSVAVHIAGHEYKIRSEGDAEALREIAGYVDRAMTRVRDRTGTVDTLDVAVLTCLNLAREILAFHEERANRSSAPVMPEGSNLVDDARMRELIERVEATLVPVRSTAPGGAEPDGDRSAEAATEDPPERTSEPEPRMLDLPSVEDLCERAASRGESSAVEAEGPAARIPEQRVAAAGGRDRSS